MFIKALDIFSECKSDQFLSEYFLVLKVEFIPKSQRYLFTLSRSFLSVLTALIKDFLELTFPSASIIPDTKTYPAMLKL